MVTRKELMEWLNTCPDHNWDIVHEDEGHMRVLFVFDEDELGLSDYERGWVECESQKALEIYRNDMLPKGEEDFWHGFQLGDRMFDINIWGEQGERPLPFTIYCAVYECQKSGDNWTTDTSKSNHLWRIEDDNA